MKKVTLLSSTAAILAALSVPAFAQSEISTGADASGISAIDDRITDIEDDVTDAFDRDADADRFGPADRRQGLFGTMSLSYTGRTGNTENQDLAIGGRINYNQGVFAQSVGLSIEFGEDDNGNKDQEDINAIYDAQYYFNDQFYAFALGRISQNGLVDGVRNNADQSDEDFEAEFNDFRTDAFLGFGPGYRILNSADTTWRVQAGVGVRYTKTGAQELGINFDGTPADSSNTDVGYIASSRLYHRFNDLVFITNDTDYLGSDDSADVITNEFGVNFRVSEQLATRVSYTTEYQEERDIRTNNTVGLAVVYGF
jgi:putative salt-induced outer membrane protein